MYIILVNIKLVIKINNINMVQLNITKPLTPYKQCMNFYIKYDLH